MGHDMHAYIAEWLTLIAVFSVAVISPGPDFVVAVRNALSYGRLSGFFTALGFGAGVLVHAAYTMIGIAALIAQSVMLFSIIKFAGAAYLFYVGFKALRSQGFTGDVTAQAKTTPISAAAAFRSGFITNLLNPKATLFFLALFTQIVGPATPHAVQAVFGLTCAIMVTLWFTAVAMFLTTPAIRNRFLKISKWVDRTCGAVFIALGLKLALAKAP